MIFYRQLQNAVNDVYNYIIRRYHMLYQPREEGQGLVEYALILVLVAVVVIVILALLGPTIGNIFSNIMTNL
jgi:pilus assembly protein Flp/PilA